MKKISFIAMFLFSLLSIAQEQLSLEECYKLVSVNYPLALQNEILTRQNTIDIDITNTGKLPQFDLNAQVTYQSDVIEVPFPGATPLNKDQYRATVSVNQLIYNGGMIDATLNTQTAALNTKKKQIEVNLYGLKKQVNQLYFSVLLLQEKAALLSARQEQLEAKLKEVKSGIEYGTILPTSDKVIEAELIKIKQQLNEVEYNQSSLFQSLSSLLGKNINPSTKLQNPEINAPLTSEIKRPELELFQLKKTEIETNLSLMSKQNSPKVFGFATGGYGNPGLNMLDNSFQAFYTVGVKLNWNIFDWDVNTKKRQSLSINKEIIDNETKVFELNTQIEMDQLQSEMEKLTGFISSDAEIIELRDEVLKSADAQLRNGVITASAYITELTNLFEAKNTLAIHKIQLKLLKANYNTTKGQ
ncbi:TolC family protein [Roseivirga sp.]|uniref:TolC family protein n=1 Tax=Roseivirga sp. TaxID=1964215 RepID=UPI002B268FDB|nr:TolC family protein [Roseivirga sp.]